MYKRKAFGLGNSGKPAIIIFKNKDEEELGRLNTILPVKREEIKETVFKSELVKNKIEPISFEIKLNHFVVAKSSVCFDELDLLTDTYCKASPEVYLKLDEMGFEEYGNNHLRKYIRIHAASKMYGTYRRDDGDVLYFDEVELVDGKFAYKV